MKRPQPWSFKSASIIVAMSLVLGLQFDLMAAETLKEAIVEGKFNADVRLRYEFVDQEGITEDAHAKTARLRMGYKTAEYMNLSAMVEGEQVFYIGSDDYNDTVNGRTDRPTVADPENYQVNQLYLQFTGIDDTTIKGGRQVIAVDGHRFIGHVGWRQNNQVFDAATVANTSIPDTDLLYGYIYNVNRIFGEQSTAGDWESDSHFYNIKYSGFPIGTLITYGYLLDFKNDSPANSNETFGISLSGEHSLTDELKLKYYGEYAHQNDFADNATGYTAHYYHLAPAFIYRGVKLTVGYEVLGSDDGMTAFRTPLATLHKWNGWADKFLTTPNNGLRDTYVDVSYTFKDLENHTKVLNGLLAQAQFHDFNADEGDADHGWEWGVYFKRPLGKNIYVDAKYADYHAKNTSADTQKFIFSLGFQY